MGKVLETLGMIDGYDLSEYGKISIKKEGIFDLLDKKDSKIKEEAMEIINEKKGEVYGITKDNVIYGIYIFKNEMKNKTKVLTLTKKVFDKDLEKETIKKYDDYLINILKDSLVSSGYKQIIVDDQIIQIDPNISPQRLAFTFIGTFIIGTVIDWFAFENIVLAILGGIFFALIVGGMGTVVVTKKKKRKKKTIKKEDK